MSKTEDRFQEALSAFNHHMTGCQCCDRYTGKSSELNLLCLKGVALLKGVDDLAFRAAAIENSRRRRDEIKAEEKARKEANRAALHGVA